VVAAYHSSIAERGAPLVLGWVRPAAGGPVTVIATATAVPAAAGLATLSFPPGSRGRHYPTAEAKALLASVPSWTRLDDPGARPSLVVITSRDQTTFGRHEDRRLGIAPRMNDLGEVVV
jgi:hypothetical protein